MDVRIFSSQLEGEFLIPPSKSHSLRALVLACFARSESKINSLLFSGDTKACIEVFSKLGCHFKILEKTIYSVDILVCPPENGLIEALKKNYNTEIEIDCKNSGTLLYFLAVILSFVQGVSFRFVGDVSLSSRPLFPIFELYNQRGLSYNSSDLHLPLKITGAPPSAKNAYSLKGDFSQVVSGLFLATAIFSGRTELKLETLGEAPYVFMTRGWLGDLGFEFEAFDTEKKFFLLNATGKELNGFEKKIFGDWSSASFPILAALASGSHLCLTNLNYDPLQGDMAILEYLKDFGTSYNYNANSGLLEIQDSQHLQGADVDIKNTPDLLPSMLGIGALTGARSRVFNLGITQYKESNRVQTSCLMLKAFGVNAYKEKNSIVVENSPLRKEVCRINSFSDHRIALAASALALGLANETIIENCECCNVSFPNFFEGLKKCGTKLKIYEDSKT